jgi:hypothetical protein
LESYRYLLDTSLIALKIDRARLFAGLETLVEINGLRLPNLIRMPRLLAEA